MISLSVPKTIIIFLSCTNLERPAKQNVMICLYNSRHSPLSTDNADEDELLSSEHLIFH